MNTLKMLRTKKGVYQKDVAEYLGVDRTTYVKYERGDSQPGHDMLLKLSEYFNTSIDEILGNSKQTTSKRIGVQIPVLGKVQAGIPIDAIEEILDYEEITPEMAARGDYFALQVRGDSMMPRMLDGDVVIVRQQPDCDSGDIAIVLVNGYEATVKRIKKTRDGITLIPLNTAYDPIYYSNKDIVNLPVVILGKVVELRGKM